LRAVKLSAPAASVAPLPSRIAPTSRSGQWRR